MNELEQAYAETAKAIVASVSDVMNGDWNDRVWERIVVNYETLLHTPETTSSTIAFSIARSSAGRFEKVDFRLSDEAESSLENVAEVVHMSTSRRPGSGGMFDPADSRFPSVSNHRRATARGSGKVLKHMLRASYSA